MNNRSSNNHYNISTNKVDFNKNNILKVEEALNHTQLFSGGDGTEMSPYLISSADELNRVRNFLSFNVHFKLIQNIDLSSVHNWLPIGDEKNKFEGKFDGDNYVIRHLVINREDQEYVGLFGYVGSKGSIRQAILVDSNISGHRYVGGLAGFNSGAIEECYLTGNVFGQHTVGGLIGYNRGGSIAKCYITGNVIGRECVGGLIGYNSNGEIQTGYVKGRVMGDSDVGGIIGISYSGKMNDCYVRGTVIPENGNIARLIGL